MLKHLKETFKHRELLFTLAQREIQVIYKQALLGVAWTVLQPLALLVIYTVVFSWIVRVPTEGIPYPLFVFSGMVAWSFFATSLTQSSISLVGHMNLVTKIYFPRELLPFSTILAAALDFAIACALFIGFLLFYQAPLTVNLLYLVPILLTQVIFTTGVALLLAAINVFYRDVRLAIPLLIQIWMFASPVLYPASLVPEALHSLYMLNPMAGILENYRNVLLKGIPPDAQSFGIAVLLSLLTFVISYWFFKRLEMSFADVI